MHFVGSLVSSTLKTEQRCFGENESVVGYFLEVSGHGKSGGLSQEMGKWKNN